MSRVEGEVDLAVSLGGLAPGAEGKLVSYLWTTRTEDARLIEQKRAGGETVRIAVPEGSIFADHGCFREAAFTVTRSIRIVRRAD